MRSATSNINKQNKIIVGMNKKRAALIITGAFSVPLQAERILIKVYKALYMFHTF